MDAAQLDLLRKVFEQKAKVPVLEAYPAAADWARAAARTAAAADPAMVAHAAESHLQWVRQLVLESELRTSPSAADRVITALQGVGAEAGYWLARAGRLTDAVAAIEAARAVLLSRRARRLPENLQALLVAGGRPNCSPNTAK